MNRRPARSLRAALFLSLGASLFPLVGARAQSEPVDLTAAFRTAGVNITDLRVYQVSDIVLIRGTAANRADAENAGVVAKNLGYDRVANLIAVAEASNDAAIVRFAQSSLGRERGLEGCQFHIGSLNGVVRVEGSVQREFQMDVALRLLRRIEGVKEVQSALTVL